MKRILTLALLALSTTALYGGEFDEVGLLTMLPSFTTLAQEATATGQQALQAAVEQAPQAIADSATAAATYAGQEALRALQEQAVNLLCQKSLSEEFSLMFTITSLAGICVAAWPTKYSSNKHQSSSIATSNSARKDTSAIKPSGQTTPAAPKRSSCFEIYKGTRELALVGLAAGTIYSWCKVPSHTKDFLLFGATPAIFALACGEVSLFKRVPVASIATATVVGGGFYRLNGLNQETQALVDCISGATTEQLQKLCAYVAQKGIKGAYNALTAQ